MSYDFKLFTLLPYDFKLFTPCLMSIHNTLHPMPYKFTVNSELHVTRFYTLHSMPYDFKLFTPCHTNLRYTFPHAIRFKTLNSMPLDFKTLHFMP